MWNEFEETYKNNLLILNLFLFSFIFYFFLFSHFTFLLIFRKLNITQGYIQFSKNIKEKT